MLIDLYLTEQHHRPGPLPYGPDWRIEKTLVHTFIGGQSLSLVMNMRSYSSDVRDLRCSCKALIFRARPF